MHRLKITLSVAGIVSLGLWQVLKPPYSPTQTLPSVSYGAFQVQCTPEKGASFAHSVACWEEVTATSYNPESGLLAVAYTDAVTETALIQRMERLSQGPVGKVHFPAVSGPKCPVPHHLLRHIPTGLLILGVAALLGAFGLALRRRVHAFAHFSH